MANLVLGNRHHQTGDVVGKLAVYYQGGYFAQDDGLPLNVWNKWAGYIVTPSNEQVNFELYPDTREYTKLYRTGCANLDNGKESMLFSSWDDSTVDLHFKWMQQYNIDVVALQMSIFQKVVFKFTIELEIKSISNICVSVFTSNEIH